MFRLTALATLAMLAFTVICATACAHQEKTSLSVFIAGSMMIPFDSLEESYEVSHPNVDLQIEAHGSIQVIRHVTDIHQEIDVVVTADHDLIPMLMYQTKDPDTGEPYARWYIEFATNQLVLAYTPESRHATEISTENWYEIIARPGVNMGLPDPRFDPAGYRALMVLQLAEDLYGKEAIFENMTVARFKAPITAGTDLGRSIIRVPEIVDPRPNSGIIVRGASMQTIALLQSGDLDYVFEYESVARQHGLEMVRLPDEINLGSERFAGRYDQVQVNLDFQRFAKVKPEFRGSVIGYGVTIPANAPHPDKATDFVSYLLGPEGQEILTANHQPLILPPRADNYQAVPAELQDLCTAWR